MSVQVTITNPVAPYPVRLSREGEHEASYVLSLADADHLATVLPGLVEKVKKAREILDA